MLAGFGQGRVIDHKDPVRVGQRFGHGRPVFSGHGRLIPAALVDELLERLLGVGHRGQFGRQADPPGERFDRFAFTLLDQPTEVDPAPEGLAGVVKVGTKTVGVRLQALEHGGPKPGRESAVHSMAEITRINLIASRPPLTE
jgi:hypothetical protein